MAGVRALVVAKLRPKVIQEMEWSDFASAVSGLSAANKARILDALKRSDTERIGKAMLLAFRSAVESKITTEADTMLADNSLNQTELERLLE